MGRLRRKTLVNFHTKTLLSAAMILMTVLCAPAAVAQTYPNRPVKIVVPLSTGTGTDILARRLAIRLSEMWGQPVVVENMPGAGGNIGAAAVAKAPADGYTLVMLAVNHAINAALYKDLTYDLQRDFKPIARLAITPLAIVASPQFPANTIPELIALAKAQPGRIVYGSGGSGSSTHLAIELLSSQTGIRLSHVPYKSIAPMLTDLMGNHISLGAPAAASVVGQVKSGKLKILGMASDKRSSVFPNVPTVAEAGVPGYDVSTWLGLAAPAGTPDAILEKVSADAIRVAGSDDFSGQMREQGMEVQILDPTAFRQFIGVQLTTWAKLVKESGAKVD